MREKQMKTRLAKLIYACFAAAVLSLGAVTASGALNDLF
jgi:hypothetical protein